MNRFDVVIIGGGAAGLSAALVLGRARRAVLVVDTGAPRNGPAARMQGFLSRDGLRPADLLAAGRAEVAGYGGRVAVDTVTGVTGSAATAFTVELATGGRVSARRLLVATGLRDEIPDIPGLRERWGRDVLHCPYCHGWEVRDRQLGVIADGSPDSVRYTQIVRQWTDDLLLFVPAGNLIEAQRQALAARGVGIVAAGVDRVLVSDDRLTGVRLAHGEVVRRDVLFVPPRFVPNDALLAALGCDFTRDGWVVTSSDGRTSVPGVWAAGNVANPRAQVITAAGEGSAAAISINASLVDEDVRDAIAASQRVMAP
jgi:thioredoxin reductase